MFGSFRRLKSKTRVSVIPLCGKEYICMTGSGSKPLNTGQDGRHVIGWAPTILQNVEAKLACSIYVRVKHLADKLDTRWLIRILFLEVHHQTECAIFEGSIGGTNDDGIPASLVRQPIANRDIRTKIPYQVITLSATGDAETPAGGSVCIRW